MNKKIALLSISFFSLVIISSSNAVPVVHDVNKTFVSAEKIMAMCSTVYQKVRADEFIPDLLIGISRGGVVPLGFLAGEQMFNNRTTRIINTQSYDGNKQESLKLLFSIHTEEFAPFTSILVIDDIADSGKTLNYVVPLLKQALPNAIIKTATLFYKKRSVFTPDYYVEETEDWIVFPWECEPAE